MRFGKLRLSILGLLGTAAMLSLTSPAHADLTMGVVSPRGELAATKRWTPLANALGEAMGEKVTLRPVKPSDQVSAFKNKDVDFLLTSPTWSAAVAEISGAKAIATMEFKGGSEFAGVIVVNPKSGIKTATDMRGKKVMGFKLGAAGGYAFQAYHLLQAGVKAPGEFGKYEITNNQDNTVLAVRAGLFDAGFVRTGIVEKLLADGKIKPGDVEILEGKKDPGRTWTRTTVLYPEWSFMAQPDIPAAKMAATRKALMAIDASSAAAKAGRFKGFVDPVSLDGVIAMLRELRLPPFNGS